MVLSDPPTPAQAMCVSSGHVSQRHDYVQRLRGQGRLIPLHAARIGTCARQICTRRGPPEEACGGINRRRSANRQKSWLDPPQSRN